MTTAFQPSPPADLTLPEPGSQTARAVLSMALRRSFEDLKALRLPPAASASAQHDYRTLREVFVGFLPGRPGAIANLLRQPVVSAPLRCLLHGLPNTDGYVAELTGQSVFGLHLEGVLPSGVRLEAPPPALLSPKHDAAAEPVPRPLSGDAIPETVGGRFPTIVDGIVLATRDNNPVRMNETHPEKEGNAIDLGGRSSEEWCVALRTALAQVGELLPDVRREMGLFLQMLVPVGFDDEKHRSASYREAIGTLYLTLHPNPVMMAEALVHEHSHAKLNALFELDPLVENSWEERFESPYRPDPRPMLGVLLGAHAFVAVERFLELVADPSQARHLDDLRRKNRAAVRILRSQGRPTEVGAAIVDELERLVA